MTCLKLSSLFAHSNPLLLSWFFHQLNHISWLGFLEPSRTPEFFLHLLPQPASGSSWHYLLSFFALWPSWTSPFLTWSLALLFGLLVCCSDSPQCPHKEVRVINPNLSRPHHSPLQNQSEFFSYPSEHFCAWLWTSLPALVFSGSSWCSQGSHFFLNKH